MKLTTEHIQELLRHAENEYVEFKRAAHELPNTLWDSYSAFCNTDGGVIILGIHDRGDQAYEIEGVANAPKLISDFWNTVNNLQKVSYSINFSHYVYPVVMENGTTVVVIEVPRAPREMRPVYIGSDVFTGTFRRSGEGDYHCAREAVRAMLRDQCQETADNCIYERLAISDLNASTISRYRSRFANVKVGHIWNGLPEDEFLTKIGAARCGDDGKAHPTLAGLVCFGDFNTITNELPDYFLDYRERLSTETRWSDRVCAHDATWSGNIYDFFFLIHDRLLADIKRPFAMDTGSIGSIEENEIHNSIRELLANALIHADYHGRQGIVIEKHFQSITFSNPGVFRMDKEVAISGGTSDARNSKIFNILALVKIGERSGMGLANLHGYWKKYNYPTPVIAESYDPDRTTVKVCTGVVNAESVQTPAQSPVQKSDKRRTNAGQTFGRKLTGTERRVLKLISASSQITIRALADKLDLNKDTISKATSSLIASGHLARVGSKRAGHWLVTGNPS